MSRQIELNRQGTSALIRLNRPEKLNALTLEMRVDLLSAFRKADADASVRAIILNGAGRAFCGGGDINHLQDLKTNDDEQGFVQLLDEGMTIVKAFRASKKPVIGAINGDTYGAGLALVLACDFCWCTPEARFAFPFIKLGLGPDWGGTWLLPRLVGLPMALEMLFSGEGIDADTALRVGLVNRVVQPDKLISGLLQFCDFLATRSPDVIARDKQAMHASLSGNFDDIAELERNSQLANFRSDWFRRGLETFFNRNNK